MVARALVADGFGGVEESAVLEERLPGILHFNDEPPPIGGLAVNVEIRCLCPIEFANLLYVFVGELNNRVVSIFDDSI